MKQKIGIWGFGIGGKAIASYLYSQGHSLEVMDKRELTQDEIMFLQDRSIKFIDQKKLEKFFEQNDLIVPSQGIDLSNYMHYRHKWLTELDLFSSNTKKPIIAITGSIGKTSVTYLLHKVLEHYGAQYALGGNIGRGALDLMSSLDKHSGALLEVSSWQLEHCRSFAPDLALWTNLYPNHLDRHKTFENYFMAKYQLLSHQQSHQKALVPFMLKDMILRQPQASTRAYSFFSPHVLSKQDLTELRDIDSLYMPTTENILVYYHKQNSTELVDLKKLPQITFTSNWLIIAAACHMSSLDLSALCCVTTKEMPAHRFEHVACINNITFYNDSKSTIAESTLAAVQNVRDKPTHLFLGGLSKGVNREYFIKELPKTIKTIFCFGAEAEILKKACEQAGFPAYSFAELKTAFDSCISQARAGDTVLFSPAGSSFDLFKDYQERGDFFKKLVKALL